MKREYTKRIKVGNIEIGNSGHVVIQSMSTFLPSELDECVDECLRLEEAGCEMVRVAILTLKDAEMIGEVKKRIHIPIVADIHFNYEFGIKAIENGADKIRFNPGNIGDDKNLKALVDCCIAHSTPVRIGVNSGSIEKDLLERHDLSMADKCVESLRKYVLKCEEAGLENLVLSVKLSNVLDTIEAYRKASQMFSYPLHIGLTESGVGDNALIKSSVAIGTLLNDGIGDTIRVSLTGDPVKEVYAAKAILKSLDLLDSPDLISCPTCGRTEVDLESIAREVDSYLMHVKKKITVAVMGCLVNGPGEAREADLGVAFIKDRGNLFKKGKVVFKGSKEEVLDELKKEIDLF